MSKPWIAFLEDGTRVPLDSATLVLWVSDPESWCSFLGASLHNEPQVTRMRVVAGDRKPETIAVIHASHLQSDSDFDAPLGKAQSGLAL